MLMDHADAGADRRLAVGNGDRRAVDADFAHVGGVEAIEDRHQRRFAGAVLADDAVDRTATHRKVNVPVCLDGAETLGNADQFDGGGGVVRPSPRRVATFRARHAYLTGQAPSDE